MEGSKMGFQTWMVATYLLTTSLKSVSSMKLHRDLQINQRTAWFLEYRLRVALGQHDAMFADPVEVDETYVGGHRKNMPKSKRRGLKGRGTVGKAVVAGAKDQATNKMAAKVVRDTAASTLQSFVRDHAKETAVVYTDEHGAYRGLPRHEAVNHSVGEYVRGMAHTQGIESFWSMLKRAHKGTFHKLSHKHLDRYVTDFAGRHNDREADTLDQMAGIVRAMVGKRLKYRDLIADNGFASGARA